MSRRNDGLNSTDEPTVSSIKRISVEILEDNTGTRTLAEINLYMDLVRDKIHEISPGAEVVITHHLIGKCPEGTDQMVDWTNDRRPAVLGGECSECLHKPPLHEPGCPMLECRAPQSCACFNCHNVESRK